MDNTLPLKIIFWNANGIQHKINELSALLNKIKADIILIGETKLPPNKPLKLRNFHIYRSDNPLRPGRASFGGTAILVHRRIVHEHITLDTNLSSTTINISTGQHTIRVSSVYKSPNQPLIEEDIEKLIDCDWFIAAGDLNSKHPLWNSRCSNTAGNILYRHVQNSDYSIISPDSPTHFPSAVGHRPDVLDIALIRLPHQLTEISNLNELSSDHNPILLTITDSPITTTPPLAKRRVNWKTFTPTLEKQITSIDLPINTSNNIDKAIEYLSTNIQSSVESSSFDLSTRFNKFKLPTEIVQEIKTKNRLRRAWQQTRDPMIKRSLNSKIKLIRLMLSTHRQDEWDTFLSTLDTQNNSIYKINKILLKKTPATHPLVGPNGLAYSANDRAELLADSYESQFILNSGPDLPEVTNSIQILNSTPITNQMFTTPGTIEQIVKLLPRRKAPGNDSISNAALKNLPKNAILLLTRIINGCLKIGYFPAIWKRSIIIAIPKPFKNHNLPVNFRPISLLSSLSKIYEKILLHKLIPVIDPHIRCEQFAFRSQHSTTLQLLNFTDHLSINANNKEKTAAVFLDIEKAFDQVWHDGLIHKLLQIPVPFQLIKTIKSFLSDRSFQVRVEDSISQIKNIAAGVPQGSCLSPLLYLVYTNDIPVNSNASIALFADDTLFYTKNKNHKRAIIQLQHQINLAVLWFEKWRLQINELKTKTIVFNKNKPLSFERIQIKGHYIDWSNEVRYLGVIIDKNLSFSMHIRETILKASKTRGILSPIIGRKSPIPLSSKILIYQLYIKSVLTYAGPVWGPYISRTNWNKIEAVQNISLRVITAVPYFVSNRTIVNSAHLPTIHEHISLMSKTLFFRNSQSSYNHIRELGKLEKFEILKKKIRPFHWTTT